MGDFFSFFFFFNRQQNFSIQMNALLLKVAVGRPHVSPGMKLSLRTLAGGLQETSTRAAAPCSFSRGHPLSVDFLIISSPTFGKLFSNVAHKLPFKVFPKEEFK